MKKVKAFILLGIIVLTLFSGGLVGYCADGDSPEPPHMIAYKH